MTNVELPSNTTPTTGDAIEVGKPVFTGVIERVLPGGTVAIRSGHRLLFAKLNTRGYYEQAVEPWDNPEYEALRRAELLPTVGDKVELSVSTYIGCDGDGGDWAELRLTGIVMAIDSEDCCKIQIEPFELVADRDYWLNVEKHDSVDDNLGLFQEDEQIN